MIKTNNTLNNIEKKVVVGLVVGILFSVFLYMYFISASVVSIVQRKNIQRQTQMLSSRVGDLESKYMSLSKNITLAYSRSVGYVEPKNVSYVSPGSFALNIGNGI